MLSAKVVTGTGLPVISVIFPIRIVIFSMKLLEAKKKIEEVNE